MTRKKKSTAIVVYNPNSNQKKATEIINVTSPGAAGARKPGKKKKKGKAGRGRLDFNAGNGRGLPDCSKDYMKCLMNPFDGPISCVPMWPAPPSYKARTWIRGDMTTGTGGLGFIMARPTTGSDAPCAVFTDSTYTNADNIIGNVTGANSTPMGNLPFSIADQTLPASDSYYSTNVQARVVSFAIRVRFTGQAYQRNGRIVCLHSADHVTFYSRNADIATFPMSFGRLLDFEEATYGPVDNTWHTVFWSPVDPEEVRYQTGSGGVYVPSWLQTASQNNIGNRRDFYYPMIIAVKVDADIKSQFEFEIFTVQEYIGPRPKGKTVNVVEPEGFGSVMTRIGSIGRNVLSYVNSEDLASVTQTLVNTATSAFLKNSGSYRALKGSQTWNSFVGYASNIGRNVFDAGLIR